MNEIEKLKKENEELKKEILRLKKRLRAVRLENASHRSHASRQWEENADYLPYEEDSSR